MTDSEIIKTCADCIHNEICETLWQKNNIPKLFACQCGCFKEKSRYIELPCKVGDTVYKLCSVNSNIKMGQMWDGKIVETNCDRCGYRNCSCHNIGLRELDKPYFINVIEDITIYNLEFLVKIMPYFGTIYFNTKEEAEAKLKECNNAE